ncbi:MAG: N-acetylmuramoyl-L-alanine amidase [Cyanobacteria bacterium J06634_5]
MRLNRLLPGLTLVGALLLALPSQAARLEFWRFNTEENTLTFTTDDGIQPTAQLLSSPTRLVIDLPGTTLNTPEEQPFDGAIKEIRVGKVDTDTTRLVVEYNDGYTVDPNQVQVRGESSRQWTVQLPDAIETTATETAATETPIASSPSGASGDGASRSSRLLAERRRNNAERQRNNSVRNRPVQGASTRIQGVTATADGFFIRTAGESPQIEVTREEKDGVRTIAIAVDQAAVALGLTSSRLPNNRYSIENWRVNQVSADPAKAEITLTLGEASPDWEISAGDSGIVILPKDVSISSVPDENPSGSSAAESTIASSARRPAATRQLEPGELPTLPNGRFTVVIDPGHGGRDPGAVGINGLQEKQVVNDIAPRVAAILRQQGVNVVMTRDRDIEVDLAPRVQTAERANASIFVSIHANAISMSRPDVNGLETFYSSDAGQRLANTVHSTVLRAMGMRDRRVRSARFYVIRRTSMPAILVETGFVTGAEDAPNLADPAWRERMATAIAQGILLHLERGI